MPYLAFDIETVMNERASALFQSKEYKPDATLATVDDPPQKILDLKTPDLKAQRLAEWKVSQELRLKQSVIDQREKDISRAALYWWTGKIICISCVDEAGTPSVFSGTGEKKVIYDFFRCLETVYPHHTLIGKSSTEFDIPYVIGRAMHWELGLPQALRHAREPIADVNRIFSARDNCQQVSSLANYVFGLGLDEKLGHGSEIREWYAMALAGDASYWEKIRTYCIHDSMLVREILKRYQKPFAVDTELTFNIEGTF